MSLKFKTYVLPGITVNTLMTTPPLLKEYLIEEGNPNSYNSTDLLAWCVRTNKPEQLEFLLIHGADPNYRSAEYLSPPLSVAIEYDDLISAEILMKYGAELHPLVGDHPLISYARKLNLEGVKLALKYGANPNDHCSYRVGEGYYPPLYHAIFTGRSKTDEIVLLKIVHLLLDHGSKPDIMVHGKPIFHFLVQNPDCYGFSFETAKHIIICLLDHGADLNVKYQDVTVMEYAVNYVRKNGITSFWFIDLIESYQKSSK